MSVSRKAARLIAAFVASGALVGAAAMPAMATGHDRDNGRSYHHHDGRSGDRDHRHHGRFHNRHWGHDHGRYLGRYNNRHWGHDHYRSHR
jgi:hypothetical protein